MANPQIEPAPDRGLADQLRDGLLGLFRHEGLTSGTRVSERMLAEKLKVSRTPVRAALDALREEGVVERSETGRWVLAQDAAELVIPAPADELYLRVAGDRLDGRLPERVTEAELARRYDLSRSQVAELLNRILSEGWIAPLPGRGWEFSAILTTMQAYQDSFRFRLLVEPAALLEPTFVLDRAAVEECLREQRELVEGKVFDVSSPALYALNSKVHEVIVGCSNNSVLIDSVKRTNRLRRLIEYRQAVDRPRAQELCQEHVRLLELVLDGDVESAAAYFRLHLMRVRREKTRDSETLLDA